jgi:hypothetical protein
MINFWDVPCLAAPIAHAGRPRRSAALQTDQYKTIGDLHGMAGVGGAGLNSQQWLNLCKSVIQAMGAGAITIPGRPGYQLIAAGFGTDTNGLAFGMAPRGRVSSGIVNLTRSSRPSWPLSLERGQPYRRAKEFSAPDRRAIHGRRIPPRLNLTMPVLEEIRSPISMASARSQTGAQPSGICFVRVR